MYKFLKEYIYNKYDIKWYYIEMYIQIINRYSIYIC